jgi:ATP-binding cassette subfamily B protein
MIVVKDKFFRIIALKVDVTGFIVVVPAAFFEPFPEYSGNRRIAGTLNDFISAFAEGYNHRLTQKGTNVSGGQKQRILIARAIAARPDILVLDDSSSALDYKTDSNLRRALREDADGMTVITVAQRVSSVKDCDLILVLDEGRISALGTHRELMERSLEYKEIAESQMGGAIIE